MTAGFVLALVSLRYLEYTHPDVRRENIRYCCTIDQKELTYHNTSAHFYYHHRNIYAQVRKIVDEHLVVINGKVVVSEDTVLCDCGGHYKVSGKR